MSRLMEGMTGSLVYKASGLRPAVATLTNLLSQIDVQINPAQVASGAIATYRPWARTIYLRDRYFDPLTVLHELVHVYNDLVTGLAENDRVDEGMAYALERIYEACCTLNLIETYSRHPPQSHWWKPRLTAQWQNYLRHYQNPANLTGGEVNQTYFQLTFEDFDNVRTYLGATLSGKRIKPVFQQLAQRRITAT